MRDDSNEKDDIVVCLYSNFFFIPCVNYPYIIVLLLFFLFYSLLCVCSGFVLVLSGIQ